MTLLQLHTPESAWKLIQIMRTGDSEQVQQRMAAKDILQHASKETAEKGQDAIAVNVNADSLAKLDQKASEEVTEWRKRRETAVYEPEDE